MTSEEGANGQKVCILHWGHLWTKKSWTSQSLESEQEAAGKDSSWLSHMIAIRTLKVNGCHYSAQMSIWLHLSDPGGSVDQYFEAETSKGLKDLGRLWGNHLPSTTMKSCGPDSYVMVRRRMAGKREVSVLKRPSHSKTQIKPEGIGRLSMIKLSFHFPFFPCYPDG